MDLFQNHPELELFPGPHWGKLTNGLVLCALDCPSFHSQKYGHLTVYDKPTNSQPHV